MIQKKTILNPMNTGNKNLSVLTFVFLSFISANYHKTNCNENFGLGEKYGINTNTITCSHDKTGKQICKNSKDLEECKFDGPYGIFLPRPQGVNSAAIFNPFKYQFNNIIDTCCSRLNLGYRYSETRKGERIATSLFGSNRLEFQGSLVGNRSNKALISEWFGLSPLHSGSVSFDPKIKQHHIDFSARLSLGTWNCYLEGAWFAVQATLVRANWNLRTSLIEEKINQCPVGVCDKEPSTGCEPLPGEDSLVPNQDGFPLYMSAEKTNFATKLEEVLGGNFILGDMKTPWKYGKLDTRKCGRKDTKLANLDLLLGYDICSLDNGHLTLFIKSVAPTGTKLDQKTAQYIFNPIIGNGGYWELGAGLDSHYDIYNCNESSVSVHLTGSITHLFSNEQWRTFDFKKYGPLSRYMLLKELTPTEDKTYDDKPLIYDYAENLQNAVNYTTRKIKSSFNVQGDASLQIMFKKCNWISGVGYNIYGKSQEKIKKVYNNNIDKKIFGMKGNTGTHYYQSEHYQPLNTTQTGLENLTSTSVPNGAQKDNPGFYLEVAKLCYKWSRCVTNIIKSVPPETISIKDIEIKEIPRQIIHKFFAHAEYRWPDCCKEPYIGIYGEYDFAHKPKCNYTTPNQWSIGVRGGITF